MSIEQFIGIPTIILAIFFFKWGVENLNKRQIQWYPAARNIGGGCITLLLAIFLLLDKIEF